MTDANTVSFLAGLSSVANIILYALIIFVIVMWVKQKDRKSKKEKTDRE